MDHYFRSERTGSGGCMEFAIQLIIILICLFYGARKGGIALGLLGGIGLVILVFVFHLQPGKPPVDVMPVSYTHLR